MGKVVIPGFRKIETSGGGGGGTSNYNDLTNKPSINNVPLVGNLNTVDLKLTDSTLAEEGVPAEAKTVGTKLEEQATSLTALSEQLGSHTVKSDVPENAVFTDTKDWESITGKPDSFPPSSHGHTISEITGLKDTLDGKASSNHTHDDRYYTETEVDTKLNKKAESIHNHTKSQITDFPTSMPANGGNADTVNSHTVKSDVPENAVFTDTVYDDTEVQKRISDNGYGEVAGGKNLFNKETAHIGKVILFSSGEMITNADYFCTDYIPVIPNTTYVRSAFTTLGENWYYGIDKNPLNSIQKNENIFTTPENAYYVRLSGGVQNVDIAQLEEGSVATSYEPYFPSNKMLAEEKADKKETTVNLLNPTLQTTTQNGVTCTNNDDGTYTLNGTATGNVFFFIQGITALTQRTTNKTYKLVGCPNGGINMYDLRYEINGSVANGGGKDFGDGVIIKNDKINSTDITSANAIVAVLKGITVNNLVFKPMLTTNLDATYDDFVPYTGDTGKLNSDVASLLKRIETLESLVNKTDATVTE